MALNDNNLVWLDLEMTGLDTQRDAILEIATIVTDPKLNILAEGPVLAIHQPDEILNAMDNWNQRQHKKTGLISRVKQSTVTAEEAEKLTLDFMKEFVSAKKCVPCNLY